MAVKWSEHDVEILKDMFNDKSQQEIIDALEVDRNWSSISKKASSLKLKRNASKTRKKTETWNKFSIEDARKKFEEYGLELLDTQYINSKTPMRFRCICGNESTQDINHLNRRSTCERCAKKKKLKPVIDKAEQFLNDNGFELLDKGNIEDLSTNKIKIKCTCGRIIYKNFNLLRYNPYCTCENKNIPKNINNKKYKKSDLVQLFWNYYNDNGEYLTLNELKKNPDLPSPSTFERKWGGYKKFLKDIGVINEDGWYIDDENVVKKYYHIGDIDLINSKLIIKRSESTIRHKANKLGLKVDHYHRYGYELISVNELKNHILDIYNKLDRNISTSDVSQEIYQMARYYFGSWTSLLKELCIPVGTTQVNKDVEIDEDEFINDYLELNFSYEELADKYGLNSKTAAVYRLCKLGVYKNDRWTFDQIQYLKENYKHAEWNEIFKELPYTKEQIITKASSLGLRRDVYFWTDEEVRVITDHYENLPFDEIKRLLPNKTPFSIMTKAHKMGIKHREFWSDEDIEMLKELYPTHTSEELQEYFPKRTISSIISMANLKLGLNKDKEKYKSRIQERVKTEIKERLKAVVEKLGRTPTSRELDGYENINSAICRRYFGSYVNACLESGIKPNQQMFGRSYNLYSINGDLCDSHKEVVITDLLIKNDINYEKSPLYREFIDDPDVGLIRTDWIVDNSIIVEYFGMPERESYAKRMAYKIELCDTWEFPLIDLYPEDLEYNFKGLIEKFRKFGIEIRVQ